jgi:hypothetical protein
MSSYISEGFQSLSLCAENCKTDCGRLRLFLSLSFSLSLSLSLSPSLSLSLSLSLYCVQNASTSLDGWMDSSSSFLRSLFTKPDARLADGQSLVL